MVNKSSSLNQIQRAKNNDCSENVIHISFFRNCRNKKPEITNVSTSLNRIMSGASKGLIEGIRETEDQARKDNLKRKLPAVTFGGNFRDRSNLIQASGLACLDFDKVQDLKFLKNQLEDSEYIFSYWLSPSGNGLKALVKIPLVFNKKEYSERYLALLKHFRKLSPDKATKDINRLCFESYDPKLYQNRKSKVFKGKIEKAQKQKSPGIQSPNIPEAQKIDRIIGWWVKKFPFTRGNRNNSLFILACALSNFGIDKRTTKDLFQSFEEEDFQFDEIQKVISSAYNKADFNSKTF